MSSANGDDNDLVMGEWYDSLLSDSTTTTSLWREDPSASFSDWKIIVENEDENVTDSTSIYHTHKLMLAKGERASKYFVMQFHLSLPTVENLKAETVLKLPALCLSCFPTFLDFVYDGTLDITKDNVVPLMELARRLQNASLAQETVAWAETELNEKNDDCALVVLDHSIELNVEEMKNASMKVIAANFASVPKDYLSKLPHEIVLELIGMVQSHLIKSGTIDHKFTRFSNGMSSSALGKLIVSKSGSFEYAIAEPAIVGPVGYWRLHVASLYSNKWLFVGIIENLLLHQSKKSWDNPTSYGWKSTGVVTKGRVCPQSCQEWINLAEPKFCKGDDIIMKLDLISNKIMMKHSRHSQTFEISIEASSTPWYIHVNLRYNNDSLLLQGASQRDFDEF